MEDDKRAKLCYDGQNIPPGGMQREGLTTKTRNSATALAILAAALYAINIPLS